MTIALIVAMGRGNVIGHEGQLPWRLPADLKHFKEITMGKPVVMGRKTYASIGKPLPGRRNIVITRDPHFAAEGCEVVASPRAALEAAGDAEETMVIGGAQIYDAFLPQATRLYLTLIEADFPGDTFFPPIEFEAWSEVSRDAHPPDERNPYAHSFVVLER